MSTHGLLRFATATDVGKVREQNEDSVGALDTDNRLLVAVCDGMGGHEAGEVASRLAVSTLTHVLADFAQGTSPAVALRDALIETNATILGASREVGRRGMGTTAIVAWVHGMDAWFGQVGDSRLYIVRDGILIARTRDHTRVEAMLQRGEISEAEARHHPETGILTRALGHRKMANGKPFEPEVSPRAFRLQPGDALVLSTDGLHDLVYDEEISEIVAGRAAQESVDILVQLALERGGHDNVTVAVITAGEMAAPVVDRRQNADTGLISSWFVAMDPRVRWIVCVGVLELASMGVSLVVLGLLLQFW